MFTTTAMKPTRKRLFQILLLASVAAPLRVADAQPRVTGSPPDVQRCELLIQPDLAAGRLRLTATLQIANPSGEQEFTFLLAGWYDTVAVRSRAGPATVTREGDAVTVRVARAARNEELVFRLSGTPGKSGGDDRAVLADSSIYLLWSDRFYPADFDDWAMVTTQLEVPRGFRVFAPGRRVLAEDHGAVHVERYQTSAPIRVASVIADARWVETERTLAGRRMRTLLYPASQAFSEQIFRTSADVLDFYASSFGPYAFDQFTFATVDGIFARRAVVGGVIYSPRYLADELTTTGHDAHETALLWWSYTIAGRGPGSYQWTEGFGDYAEMLYDEARELPVPGDFERYRRGYLRTAGTPDELPITAPRGPLAGNFVHGRLPWVMHLLRFAVGDAAFNRGVRLLFDRWRFRSITLEQFAATLAEGTGQPLDWWRREWLERGGVPELTWQADVTPDSGGYRVVVSVRQAGALYHLPLEIGIESAQGLRVERVQLDEPAREFRFWSASEPARVLIDPHRWLLAKITAQAVPAVRSESTTVRSYDGRTMPAELVRLTVPERRAQPGRTVTVAALRLSTTALHPGRPVVFLMGGPGIPGTAMAPIPPYFTLFQRLRESGDVIIVDQRGIGRSEPALDCPFDGALPVNAFVNTDRLVAAVQQQVAACAEQWRARGVEPTAYNTVESADDIDDLRASLGIEKVDLLAFSYGTRLALAVVQRHGSHVGRVVLQGVNGPGLVVKRPGPVARKLQRLSDLLKQDSAWHAPTDLLVAARTARERLQRAPVAVLINDRRSGQPLTLGVGREGFDAIAALNLDDARLPALLASAAAGDDRVLTRFVEAAWNGLTGGTVGLMARAVNCAADRPDARWEVAARESATAPFGAPIDNAFLTADFCRAVGYSMPPVEFAGPVRSTVPVLMLTGALDATNPIENASDVTGGIENATILEVENAAHEALTVPAVQDVVVEFLRGADVRGRRIAAPKSHFATIAEALQVTPQRVR